jgi:hypothetical protein
MRYAKASEQQTWNDEVLGIKHDPNRARVVIRSSGSAPGRPQVRFVDVGGRWVDQKDRARREKAAVHRALLSAQRHNNGLRSLSRGSNAATRLRIVRSQAFKRAELRRLNRRKRRASLAQANGVDVKVEMTTEGIAELKAKVAAMTKKVEKLTLEKRKLEERTST